MENEKKGGKQNKCERWVRRQRERRKERERERRRGRRGTIDVPGIVVISDKQHVLENGMEVGASRCAGCHSTQHPEHIIGVSTVESRTTGPREVL